MRVSTVSPLEPRIDSNLRELVRWGYLWLSKGIWEGEELIPGDDVELATHLVNPGLSDSHYGYNWFVNAGRSLWPNAPQDSYGHPGNGTLKPSEEPSRTYLWICPSLNIVAAMVAHASTDVAGDIFVSPRP